MVRQECIKVNTSPYLSRIEGPPPKRKVVGSNPARDAKIAHKHYVFGLFCLPSRRTQVEHSVLWRPSPSGSFVKRKMGSLPMISRTRSVSISPGSFPGFTCRIERRRMCGSSGIWQRSPVKRWNICIREIADGPYYACKGPSSDPARNTGCCLPIA